MKKLLATVLATVTLLSATTTAFAAQIAPKALARTTVRVGYLENYGMILTPIVQGSEGYGYEYLEKLEEYTNYDFEYVELSWAEGLNQLKSGEIDLLAPASMSEKRKEEYDFVDAVFLQEETNIYVLEDSDYHYGNPEQLDGKTVSTMEGSIYETRFEAYAKEHGLEYTLTHLNSSSVIQGMKRGEIDIYVDGSLHLQEGLDSIDKICTENLYFMTQKGNDALNEAITAAIVALEENDPYYNEFLWYKYYAEKHQATQKLTKDEIAALESKDVYTVGYPTNLHPTSYLSPSGEPMGSAVDVMNLLANKLNIEIRYVPLYEGAGTSAEDVDFNLSTVNHDAAIYYNLSDSYDVQNLLAVTEAGVKKFDVQHIMVPDYLAIPNEDYSERYPFAVVHRTHSSTESAQIRDAFEIDCLIIPESSEVFLRDRTEKKVSVLNTSVSASILVSNELPSEILTALNKVIASLDSAIVDELVMENVLNLQMEPTFWEMLLQYQRQISAILVLIAGIIFFVLWKSRKKIKHLLEVDTLTGAMTQYKFAKEARRILAAAKPNEYMMILLDIDQFKTINKFYGPAAGDKALRALANTLKRRTVKGSIVGRIQSDTFAILTEVNDCLPASLNSQFIDAQYVKERKQIGIDIPVYCSVGACLVENTTDNVSFILDNARTAKNYGKTILGNTLHYFTKEMQEKYEKESKILSSMELALADEAFFIMVQPKVALQTEQLVGGEVLVRWKRKDGALVCPDEFVPLMEENKFITRLDHYVLQKTCEFIRDSKLALPVLSINVSAATMLEPNFIKASRKVLQQYGVKPQQLEVELTESVLDADFERISNMISQLKQIGVAVAIDDFGKGASSLARIKEIEVDVLKLDKEFIDTNTENEKGKLVLSNIIAMASDLGITSLAEGIETKEQQALLIALGCEQGQGYCFGKPLLPQDYLQRVAANESKAAASQFVASETMKGYMTHFDHLPYAVAITQNNPDYTVLKANALFYRIIGYTKAEFLQQHQNRLAAIFWGDSHPDIAAQTHGEDIDLTFAFCVQTKTGSIVWLHNQMHYDASRDLFFSNVVDITKERQAGEIPQPIDAYKAHQQELMQQDEMSRMNVLEVCQKNLHGITREKSRVVNVLAALRHHYGARAVTVLEFSRDRKTYDVTYESLAADVPSIVAEYQNVPMESLNTVVDNLTEHMEFSIASKEIGTLSEDLRDEWAPFGISSIVSAPLYNRHNQLFGVLCVSNVTLNQRAQTLLYGVAKHIADYLITVQAHQKSMQDSLTGLRNKKETERSIANCLEQSTGGVMFIIDMDHFKNINDALGHMAGDEMLEMAAQAIKDIFRSTDVQGRIGGDEFMVFCAEAITDELVSQKANAILSRCNRNYAHAGGMVEASCTIGIARATQGETFQSLYEKADKALYHAKAKGKNQFCIATKDSEA